LARSRTVAAFVALGILVASGVMWPGAGRADGVPVRMQVRGVVLALDGAPCFQCEVAMFDLDQEVLLTAVTDERGRFTILGAPAGTYRFRVSGPDGYSVTTNDESDPAYVNSRPVSVTEGKNVVGLRLMAPPRLEDVPPPSPESQGAGITDAVPRFNCGPFPGALYYRGVQAFAVDRGPDNPELDGRCDRNGKTAAGCVRSRVLTHPQPPAAKHPDCDFLGKIALPLLVFHSTMRVRPPDWDQWDREPPDAQGCAQIRTPQCTGYNTYRGTQLHECTHRLGDEAVAGELFRAYLQTIQRIQATIDSCGGGITCCLKHLPQADREQDKLIQRMLADTPTGRGSEQEADEAECRDYKQRWENWCASAWP
jgi:hypothetical protein